jgi:hypothetical protein
VRLRFPCTKLFYDSDKPPEVPNPIKRKPSDDLAWGSSGKDANFLNKLRRLLGKANEDDRKLILDMLQKTAR